MGPGGTVTVGTASGRLDLSPVPFLSMISPTALFLMLATPAIATWTMSGYACGQQQLYNQCQCPSFCSGYTGGYGGYTYIYPQYRDTESEYSRYQEFVRKHKPKPKRPPPKKKFHFSEEEEDSSSLEDFNSKEFGASTAKPAATTNSWDNEDLWEKKFVKTKSGEELPEITSAEIESATMTTVPQGQSRPQPIPQPAPAAGGQGIGPIGIGGGVGVGGVGVNTGLGITAPGVGGGGLGGLGTGSLVGVNSGLGIGIPGVGPIGVSSGIGIGK